MVKVSRQYENMPDRAYLRPRLKEVANAQLTAVTGRRTQAKSCRIMKDIRAYQMRKNILASGTFWNDECAELSTKVQGLILFILHILSSPIL